jgi:hypothetical protein
VNRFLNSFFRQKGQNKLELSRNQLLKILDTNCTKSFFTSCELEASLNWLVSGEDLKVK